jgi:hypothetical protein
VIYPHEIKDGFLDVTIEKNRADIVSKLRRQVIRWVSMDDSGSMEKIFRCSRMCWELSTGNRLTDLDAEDVDILLSLPLSAESGTFLLFKTLNATKHLVQKSGLDPKTTHTAAIGLQRSMTS